MKECSFYSDQNCAASRSACSTHGDQHPVKCALAWQEECKQLLLQVSEQQKKYSDLLQSHASLCGKIEEFMEECAKARIYWRDPKMDGSHANLVVALLDKYGKGPVKWVKNV